MKRLRLALGLVLRRFQASTVEIRPSELNGLRMVVPRGYKRVYEHGYEPEMALALGRLVRVGGVCADVGAHLGYFALLMASATGPSGRVVAFEANEDNASVVRRSAALNARQAQIEVRQVAITDGRASHVAIYPGRAGGGMEWTVSREFAAREDRMHVHRPSHSVPAIALDDAFPSGTELDVVKMDIEGAEAMALAGASRLLREQRPTFVIEFHREVGWSAIDVLRGAGYRFEELDGKPIETPTDAQAVPYQFVARPE